MLAQYGTDTVAGFGVASRVESLTLVMFYALSAVIGPFVGQNISGNRPDRIFRALKLCTLFCLGTGLIIAVMLAFTGGWVAGLFSENVEVRSVATLFLLVVPISYGAYGIVMVMNASFNGMGKPMPGCSHQHSSNGRNLFATGLRGRKSFSVSQAYSPPMRWQM